MANFQETTPPNFTPYVAQLPVETMAEVGMYKQQKYEAGVQKIQDEVTKLGGLQVIRDVDKAYLQSKINELGSDLRMFMASDFSDFQLQNAAMSMTSKVSGDANVRNAVASTQRYMSEKGLMEEDRKKGTLMPENEDFFNKQVSPWMNNNDVSSSFNGSYVPYFDVFKYVKETFDAIKPDELTYDQIFVTGPDGKPVIGANGKPVLSNHMVRLEQAGLFPEKVKQTLDQIFSNPNVSRQLNITGQYVYKGISPEQLTSKFQAERDALSQNYGSRIIDLEIRKAFGEDVSKELDDVMTAREKEMINYDNLFSQIQSNPDGVKGMLYTQDTRNRFTNMFSWMKTKTTVHDNPAWRAEFDMNKEANRRAEWLATYNADQYWKKIENERADKRLNWEMEKDPAKKDPLALTTSQFVSDPEDTAKNIATLEELGRAKYDNAALQFVDSQNKYIWEGMQANPQNAGLINKVKSSKTYNPNGNLTDNEAIEIIIKQGAQLANMSVDDYKALWVRRANDRYDQLANKNKVPAAMLMARDQYNRAAKVFEIESNNKQERDELQNKYLQNTVYKEALSKLEPTTIIHRGKEVNLSKQDQLDIAYLAYATGLNIDASWKGDSKMEKDAKERLERRGLTELAKEMKVSMKAGEGKPLYVLGEIINMTNNEVSELMGQPTDYSGLNYKSLVKVAEMFGSPEFKKSRDVIANKVKEQYHLPTDKSFNLLNGNNEHDRGMKFKIMQYATQFNIAREGDPEFQNEINQGRFQRMMESFDKNGTNYTTNMLVTPQGEIKWKVTSLSPDGKIGEMMLTEDQAQNLNPVFSSSNFLGSDQVQLIRQKMRKNGGSTSIYNPVDVETYRGKNDYVYDNSAGDFPFIPQKEFTVRANIKQFGNLYIPYIYVEKNGLPPVVIEGKGNENLEQVNATLQSFTTNEMNALLLQSSKNQAN